MMDVGGFCSSLVLCTSHQTHPRPPNTNQHISPTHPPKLGAGLLGRGHPSPGRPRRPRHPVPPFGKAPEEKRGAQAPHPYSQQMRPGAGVGGASVGQASLPRVPDVGVPCLHHEFVREGEFDQFVAAVCEAPPGQEADFSGGGGLPECGQVLHYQYLEEQEGRWVGGWVGGLCCLLSLAFLSIHPPTQTLEHLIQTAPPFLSPTHPPTHP